MADNKLESEGSRVYVGTRFLLRYAEKKVKRRQFYHKRGLGHVAGNVLILKSSKIQKLPIKCYWIFHITAINNIAFTITTLL